MGASTSTKPKLVRESIMTLSVGIVSLFLRAKAEMVFGALLVARNRTVRLACLLSSAMLCFSLVDYLGQTQRADQQTTVLLIAGTLSAVAGSRLLAPGSAIAASRQVAARFWLVPFGRLIGCVLVVYPVVAVAAFLLRAGDINPVQLSVIAAVYGAAVASAVLTLAPAVGGSVAAVVGFLSVWAGVVHPVDVHRIFERWPVLQRAIVVIWHLLPLQWRAGRLVDELNWSDPLVLLGWTVSGVVLAGWVTTPVRFGHRWYRGDEWQL